MSFALAIRNTVSETRQTMLTTTSLIVIFTVIIQGGAANFLLNWLKIPVGVDEETEQLNNYQVRSDVDVDIEVSSAAGSINSNPTTTKRGNDKAILARIWGNFDTRYMKPLLTHSRPTLLETLPVCCTPLARLLTTTEQMTQDISSGIRRADSDSDIGIEDEEYARNMGGGVGGNNASNNGNRRNSINRSESSLR